MQYTTEHKKYAPDFSVMSSGDFAEQHLEKLKNFYFDHLQPALYAETV